MGFNGDQDGTQYKYWVSISPVRYRLSCLRRGVGAVVVSAHGQPLAEAELDGEADSMATNISGVRILPLFLGLLILTSFPSGGVSETCEECVTITVRMETVAQEVTGRCLTVNVRP